MQNALLLDRFDTHAMENIEYFPLEIYMQHTLLLDRFDTQAMENIE